MGLIPYYSEIVLQQVYVLLSSTRIITPFLLNPTNKMSSVYTITTNHLHKIKNQAIILINSIKKDQRLVYSKL